MLFYLLCSADSGHGARHPADGALERRLLRPHLLGLRHLDVPVAAADPSGCRPLAGGVPHPHARRRRRANARANGFRGAMYPWEADERGHETTPHFAMQNARSEIHVTGDVALAQWQYYLATGDSAWLAREGFPSSAATADFWVSRATRDSTAGRYHITNVVSVARGPDRRDVTTRTPTPSPGRTWRSLRRRAGGWAAEPDPTLGRGRGEAPYALRLGQRVLPHLRGRPRLHARRRDPAPELPARRADERPRQAGAARAGRRAAAGRGTGRDDGLDPALGGRRRAGRPGAGGLAPATQLPAPPARARSSCSRRRRPTTRSTS